MEKEFKVPQDVLASQGQRFINYIIDIIIIYILVFIIAFAIAIIVNLFGIDGSAIFESMGNDGMATLIFIGISTIYYVIFEGFFSRSVAKFITKTIVVNADGSKPGFGTIFKRTLCRIIPFDALSYLRGQGQGLA